jgi:hypothetical protein
MKPGKIEFIEYHQPALESGDYTVTVQQEVTIKGELKPQLFPPTPKEQKFSILGPRFTLDPQEIQAVFPPPGSLGEHSNVLPHIILKRSTLPWERLAVPLNDQEEKALAKKAETRTDDEKKFAASGTEKKKIPWLALLLFDESEASKPVDPPIKVADLSTPNTVKFPTVYKQGKVISNPPQPYLELEFGDHDKDTLTVIDVPKKLLADILPAKDELKLLAHVRQTTDAAGVAQGDEVAVIICNRLPKSGSMSIVHLVSLESRYSDSGFDFQGAAKDSDLIRLVSLYSWRFACLSKDHSFKGLLMNLYRSSPEDPHTLRLPKLTSTDSWANGTAEKYFVAGYAALPHEMRQGNTSVSWYHGPLIPGSPTGNQIELPIRSADELARYNPTVGMFDVSYSAAWELGRLLTLQNKRASVELFNWKRSHAQSIKDADGRLTHLPFDAPTTLDLPDSVRTWFEDLALLKGLPFNYLIPDEKMLPTESIRFFQVDESWVECLLDGAFSIGRVLSKDHERDSDLSQHLPGERKLSGFLLRSDVVAGWPGLLVDGYANALSDNQDINELDELFSEPNDAFRTSLSNRQLSEVQKVFQQHGTSISPASIHPFGKQSWLIADAANQKYYLAKDHGAGKGITVYRKNNLPLWRMDRLSKNVLLCLFEGLIQTVDIHLKPETLHFGVSEGDDDHKVNGKVVPWYKMKRDKEGNEPDPNDRNPKEVVLKDRNVVNIAALAAKLTTSNNSAEFALQMIEGVEKVRFVQKAG